MISSYSDYLTQVVRLIDGDDVTVTTQPTATLELIIGLAEKRIYREARSRNNEKAFASVTVTSNAATIPTDFEMASIIHFGKKSLLPVSEEWLREYLQNSPTGDCRYFAQAGGSFMFGPAVADATAVQGRYYYRHPDLTTATFAANTLIQAEPDLFLFAALVEASPFFPNQAIPLQVWMAKYMAVLDQVNWSNERAATESGRLIVKPSTRLMG